MGRDGHKLGRVDRLVVDEAHRRVEALVVQKLLQAADRLFDIGLVEQAGEDGGFLRITAGEAKRLPVFVR